MKLTLKDLDSENDIHCEFEFKKCNRWIFFVGWQCCPCVYFEGLAVNTILIWMAFD